MCRPISEFLVPASLLLAVLSFTGLNCFSVDVAFVPFRDALATVSSCKPISPFRLTVKSA